jgi:hypothetical protein
MRLTYHTVYPLSKMLLGKGMLGHSARAQQRHIKGHSVFFSVRRNQGMACALVMLCSMAHGDHSTPMVAELERAIPGSDPCRTGVRLVFAGVLQYPRAL